MKKEDYENLICCLCLIASIFLIILIGFNVKRCGAGEVITPETYSPQELCTAIFHAEGGENATWKYGIRSVKYEDKHEDTADAREICLRTARNNIKRYTRYGHRSFDDYLRFFANRWAPINAENDPKGLNSNFYKNLKWFLENPKEIKP